MAAKGNVYGTTEEQDSAMGARLFTLSGLGNVLNSLAQAVADRGGFGGSRGAITHLQHGPGNLHCPWCEGDVFRVRRRMGDRFASVLSPRQRYRCMSWSCRWEGTIRVKR